MPVGAGSRWAVAAVPFSGDDVFAQCSTADSQLQGGFMTSWNRGVAMARTAFDGRRGGGYGGLRIVLRRRLEVMAIGMVLPREYIFMSFPSVLNDSTCWELMPLNDEETPHHAENLNVIFKHFDITGK
ncbi:hypothetical protein HYALB_00007214 [Hymenoscyphus albidus]|uniref:Uncharacterized protein n=1 Tax=Hymenoscyphus albidus TaxID=595503 RepID=A0A9N9LDH1_9HELO|nr:hypothetical protein HYALB_00007214 [Hymenoscyphus albidus]